MKKTVNTIGMVAQGAGTVALLASFFIKDNEKAVNTRWAGLGLLVGGTITRFATIGMKEATTKK